MKSLRIPEGGSSEVLVQELSEADVSSAVPSKVKEKPCNASSFEGSNTLHNAGLESKGVSRHEGANEDLEMFSTPVNGIP